MDIQTKVCLFKEAPYSDVAVLCIKCACVCGQPIKVIYHLKSAITSKKLAVGCDCIGKVVIHNPELGDELEQAKKEGVLWKQNLRACELCGQYNISANSKSWVKLCKPCWIQHKEKVNRECKMCGNYSIPKDSPSWKKVCVLCYKKSKNL